MKLIKEIKNLEKNDKTMLLLIFTTIGNIIIAITKFIFSITIPSLWFFVNACFLAVLSISRFFSIRNYGKRRSTKDENIKKEIGYKNYLHNGVLLIILGIMYFFVSVYMYYKGTNTIMHEYLTYLVALNAFWSISWSIYGMVKYKRKSSPILKSVKITSFANALTSIVLTQVVLLDTYASEYDLANINGYTGMGVSVIIMIMGLYMIINIKKIICLESN
ncbi:MAG: hypothetical protein IJE89_01770 [Bacilli bacterium]|nr:hypothetical protein [Bacilli bacterium]